jgi:hypothetical protein
MSNLIVRSKGARSMLGVGNTRFYEDYVFRGDDQFVPGTDVPRLRPVPLGVRSVGYFVDEIEALAAGLRRYRDANPPKARTAVRRHAEGVAA